jgi:tetratricopeptide (TPR) repeat protein
VSRRRSGAAFRVALFGCALAAVSGRASAEEQAPATVQDALVVDEPGVLTDAQKEEAKQHFVDGRKHYADGEFNEAADHFVKAYDLTHAPELLYNLARCYEHLGEKERAADQYEMYLRMSPDAEDRVEVEKKIAELKPAEPAPKVVGEEDKPAEEEGGQDVRLGVESGIDIPITGEWSRKSVPVDVVLLFGINGWLHLGFGLAFVGFVGDAPVGEFGYPTGEFELHGDLAVLKTIKGRFAFSARLAVTPAWIFRSHTDTALWLLARVGVGLHIDIWKSFGVLVEAVGAVGPVFNRDPEGGDGWPAISLAVDAGGRLGITYVF